MNVSPTWQLALLGTWHLLAGDHAVDLHKREQRLVAVLAIEGPRPRAYVSGMLWPESTEQHAAGNLRAAILKIDRAAPRLLRHDRSGLALHPDVHVDLADLTACIEQIGGWTLPRATAEPSDSACLAMLLRGDLLPGWYDDWVLYERTRLQQARLRALELLTDRLSERGEYAAALVAGSVAVTIEPLSESTHRALIHAQMRAGNYHDALKIYQAFRNRIMAELGIRPTERMQMLVRPLLIGTVGRRAKS